MTLARDHVKALNELVNALYPSEDILKKEAVQYAIQCIEKIDQLQQIIGDEVKIIGD